MALDYYEVQPHKVTLLGGHFTRGRDAIVGVARHHTAGVLDAGALNHVWRPNGGRQASTNYLTDPNGVVSQHVWDNNTAWANANTWANRNLLSTEHSNNAGGPGWPISDETIIGGARWNAALLRFYQCGRPEFNVNVFDHRRWTATSCPHHLHAYDGKYNDEWFEEATWFYDQLQARLVDAQGNPIKQNFPKPAAPAPEPKKKGLFMHLSESEEREILDVARALKNALLKPVPSQVEGSDFQAPRVDFIDLIDRKVEELHLEYSGRSSQTQVEIDDQVEVEKNHDLADEDCHEIDDEEDK